VCKTHWDQNNTFRLENFENNIIMSKEFIIQENTFTFYIGIFPENAIFDVKVSILSQSSAIFETSILKGSTNEPKEKTRKTSWKDGEIKNGSIWGKIQNIYSSGSKPLHIRVTVIRIQYYDN